MFISKEGTKTKCQRIYAGVENIIYYTGKVLEQ